jgi:hypothetical protein
MIDLIQSEFRKIVLKCINRYAKDNTLNPDNVQLMLGLNEEGNTYQIMVNYAKKEDFSIMQVLGVRVDFLGYSKIAPPFILKSLVRFAERLKKSDEEVYKILGQIMVKAKKENILKELEEKKKVLDLRLKKIENQEKIMSETRIRSSMLVTRLGLL